MTLNLRSASTSVATTKGTPLTHAEMDANWLHALQSANHEFAQSGIGAVTSETVQAALRRFVHTAQYDTQANYDAAVDALTGTVGLNALDIRSGITIGPVAAAGSSSLLVFETEDANRANFNVVMGDFTFNGTVDSVWRVGYNIANGGNRVVATEPAWSLSIESDFNDGSNTFMELHLEGIHEDGTSFRNWSWAINRTTNFIEHFIAADKTTLFDGTQVNQAMVFNLTTTSCTIIPGAGTQFTKEPNNAQWLSQLNAAGSAYVELLRLNASNVVYIAPGGGGARIHSALTMGDSATPQIIFSPSSGSTLTGQLYQSGNVLFIASQGVANRASIALADGAITACVATAIPAGGQAGSGLKVSSTANFGVFFGSGAPSLSAAKGSLYLRSDGTGTGDRAYINTNGSTTWTALTTAA